MAFSDFDRLKRSLENRENQLKEMSQQLSQHLSLIDQKDQRIAALEEQLQITSSKLQNRERLLEQERKAKEIMFERLTVLEKLAEKGNLQRTSALQKVRNFFTSKPSDDLTSAYVDFYSQGEGSPQTQPVATSEVDHEVAPPPQRDFAITQDDLDITKELESMGIRDITSKY